MREEEKLARDVYQAFAGNWSTQIFENISASEVEKAIGEALDSSTGENSQYADLFKDKIQ